MRTTLAFATVMLAGAAVAAAQGAGPGPAHRHGPNPARLQQELGLSEEQAAQLRQAWSAAHKQAIRNRADLAIARLELREALEAPTIDEKLVASKLKALTDLQAAAERARVERQLSLARILTPEQRQKMQGLQRERVARRAANRPHGSTRRTPMRGGAGPRNEGPQEF